jgi:excinuclease UvrABC ATPase subunit
LILFINNGGKVIAIGTLDDIISNKDSLTEKFLLQIRGER